MEGTQFAEKVYKDGDSVKIVSEPLTDPSDSEVKWYTRFILCNTDGLGINLKDAVESALTVEEGDSL